MIGTKQITFSLYFACPLKWVPLFPYPMMRMLCVSITTRGFPRLYHDVAFCNFFLLLCIRPPCLSFPPVLSKHLARDVANSGKAWLCAHAKVRVFSTSEGGFRVTSLRRNDCNPSDPRFRKKRWK